jgi:CDP-glycerol glycerophosphotransferase
VPTITIEDLDQRLHSLEALGDGVSQAIESLKALVVKKTGEAEALQAKVAELDNQLQLERVRRDLERTSRMHPKARSVVFVGTSYFGDNVKYAWLAFRRRAERDGIACWFLPQTAEQEQFVRGAGGECFPTSHADWSADHLHEALSAAVVVTSDHLLNPNPYAGALLAGARHVQIWHGVSIKEIGLRNLIPFKFISPQYAKVLATCGPFASLVGTAAAAEGDWRRWFAFERYAPIGYPRNDVLHREPTEDDLLNVDRDVLAIARAVRAEGRRVIMYAPTFRDANPAGWIIRAGLARIAKAIEHRRDCLIVNMHPVEQQYIGALKPHLPGVIFVAPRTDMYPLLRESDMLVTDYSSVMFDYLHLDRPVVLFRPDHREYTEKSRRLYDAKLARLPGPLVTDADALIALLSRKNLPDAEHRGVRAALREELFDAIDGGAAERLGDLIADELARAIA